MYNPVVAEQVNAFLLYSMRPWPLIVSFGCAALFLLFIYLDEEKGGRNGEI